MKGLGAAKTMQTKPALEILRNHGLYYFPNKLSPPYFKNRHNDSEIF